ncbi:MAG: hypothetical protein ABRQ38_21870 [Candidatus Eremiobacterota bacterium]
MKKDRKNDKPAQSSSQEKKLPLYQTIINTIVMFGTLTLVMLLPVIGLALSTGIIVSGHPVEGLYFAVFEIICSILIISYLSYRAGAGIPHYIEFIMLNLILAVIFAVIGFSYYTIKQHIHLNGCKTNLKNIVSSLDLYAQDNKGYYPPSLDRILAKSGTFRPSMDKIPLCPARYDWDNKLYNKIRPPDKSPHYLYTVSGKFDNFTLCCNTPNIHKRIKKGTRNDCWPQYSSRSGLLSGPGSKPVKIKNP